jgi:aspartyl-tRNA(Asn)/glutamyl-tRNA(Gln) amidotransferase subunit B
VFNEMLSSGKSPADAMQALGIARVDRGEIVELCRRLLSENPQIVAEVKGGKQKALGALIGQAKRHNPNANPATVREIFLQLIETM